MPDGMHVGAIPAAEQKVATRAIILLSFTEDLRRKARLAGKPTSRNQTTNSQLARLEVSVLKRTVFRTPPPNRFDPVLFVEPETRIFGPPG
jgi:hypothetical protein